MAPPVPFLKTPVPGKGRSHSGTRTPRMALALAIPPSPSHRALDHNAVSQLPQPPVPPLSLITPMGSHTAPREGSHALKLNIGMITDDLPRSKSRSDSFHNVSVPGSATSSAYSEYPIAMGHRGYTGTSDPASAISSVNSDMTGASGMEREDSRSSLSIDFEKLELEGGEPLDVKDLDDDGWSAASYQNRIVELGSLGEGAGGAVTRCVLKGRKTVFALKIITTSPDEAIKKQILRELKFNKNCKSDYICEYYGAFADRSSSAISIAMEFCEGGSLDSIYREVKKLGGRTGEKVLAKIAEGVLHGLTYLNGRKIIHRDIKPSNILLCKNGQIKLCDFGVSGEFGTKGDANTFIGTSYYMAPERIQGQSYTITSDVWSLGVTLLEVAQHRFPFPADGSEIEPRAGLIDLLTYIVSQQIPTLKDEAAIKWGDNFKYFIQCCLEKDPRRRATPWRMLQHPWMEEMSHKKVSVAKYLKQVWNWPDEAGTEVRPEAL